MEKKLILKYGAGNDTILEIWDAKEFIIVVSPENPNQEILIPKGLLSLLAEDLTKIETAYLSEIKERHRKWKRESCD